MNEQQWLGLAELARPQLNRHKSEEAPGPPGLPGVLGCASLSKDETKKHHKASYASKPSPVTVCESYLCSLQTSPVPHRPCQSARVCRSSKKPPAQHQKIFCVFSLWSPDKSQPIDNGKVYQYHLASSTICWVFLSIMCPFTCLC